MKTSNDFNFSSLIRTEFDKLLSTSNDDHFKSDLNQEEDSERETYLDKNMGNSSLNSSSPNRKWYPNRKWDSNELKSMIKIEYDTNQLSFSNFQKTAENKSKKQNQYIQDKQEQRIRLADSKTPQKNIKIFSYNDKDQEQLVYFSINTNIEKSIQLQYYLVELTDETFDDTVNTLNNMNYFTSIQNVHKLIYELISVITIRKEKTNLFVKLIETIITKSNNKFSYEEPYENYNSSFVTTESILLNLLLKPIGDDNKEFLLNVPKIFLLKKCMKQGIFTGRAISDCFEKMIRLYPNRINYQNLVYCFFAPTFETYYKSLSNEIMQHIYSTSWYSSTFFHSTLNEFYDLKNNDWILMDYLTDTGFLQGSIEDIISQDNLELLKGLISKLSKERSFLRTVFDPTLYSSHCLTLIEWTALCGSFKTFQYLIDKETHLSKLAPYAIAGGNMNIYNLCNAVSNQKLSLIAAAEFRRYNIFDDLLKYARKTDYDELLVYCSKSNNLRSCQSCINAGGNINHHSEAYNDMTALHQSAKHGHIDITSYLLCCSFINVNCTDKDKNTPLHLAAKNNRYEIIMLLLNIDDVNVNAINKDGRTALHEASIHGCIECVRVLCSSQKIDLNIKDLHGMTAIMCANRNGQTIVREFLSSLPAIESDLTQKKITYSTAAQLISSQSSMNTNDTLSNDDFSQDLSSDPIFLNILESSHYQKYLSK